MLEMLTYYLIAVNFAAFAAFGIDKARAEAGGWRISEATLVGLAGAGGLLGAYAGRAVFRHKTRKRSFNDKLAAAGTLQLGLVALVCLVKFSGPVFPGSTLLESEEERAARIAVEQSVYYPGCNLVRSAGKAPLYRGTPGYREEMDGDGDGIACEPYH